MAFFVGMVTTIPVLIIVGAVLSKIPDTAKKSKRDLDKSFKEALAAQTALRTLRDEFMRSLVTLMSENLPGGMTKTSWDGNKCTVSIDTSVHTYSVTVTFIDPEVVLPNAEIDKIMNYLAKLKLDIGEDNRDKSS
jgi:hypothetical protein